jgi:hypothetical protein
LARKGSNVVYSTIPKSWKWLIVNYVVNVVVGILLGFYIFKGGRLRDDYIRLCKPYTCMVMQKRTWTTIFLFKEFISFFNKLVPVGVSLNNQHLLFLDGYGGHVTIEVIKQVKNFGLDKITLPSHTSHALQPLDVSYFKPFKTAFRKFKVVVMFRSNHMEPDKIIIVGWVDQALKQSLTKEI